MLDKLRTELISAGDQMLEPLDCYIVLLEIEASRATTMFRFFIDRNEGGVTVQDCARSSRLLRTHLDTTRYGPDNYGIEVSSPGIERRIGRCRDFIRFAGRKVKLRLRTPLEGRRRLEAVIKEANEEQLTVEWNGVEVAIPMAQISRANLTYDFEAAQEG